MVAFCRSGYALVGGWLWIILWSPIVYAQETLIEPLIEDVTFTADEPTGDVVELIDLLEERAAHPIFLPTAHREQLASLPFLTPLQIEGLLKLQDSLGVSLRWEDIVRSGVLDPLTLQRLRPFVRFRESFHSTRWSLHQIFKIRVASTDWEQGLSLPFRAYFRLTMRKTSQWRAGIVYEKDPGESWLSQPTQPEYLSYHVSREWNARNKIILGDYEARWGQGLILWHGFAINKSREVMGFYRSFPPLREHTSVSESDFFRGIAARGKQSRNYRWMILGSYRRMDARYDTFDDKTVAVRLIKEGYHRTPLEIARRGNLGVGTMGAALEHHGMLGSWGIHALTVHFANNFDPSRLAWGSSYPSGRQWSYVATSWRRSWQRAFVFGEAALQYPWGWGICSGMMLQAMDISLGIMARHYNPSFYPVMGLPPTFGSSYAPESGVYYAFQWREGKRWILSGYVDIGKSLFLRYRYAQPLWLTEWFLQAHHTTEQANNRFFFRRKLLTFPQANPGALSTTITSWLNVVQGDFKTTFTDRFQWHGRIEARWESGKLNTSSALTLSDIHYWVGDLTRLTCRIAWATITSQATRIYAYEHDVPYAFSFYQFTQPTWRTYLVIRHRMRNLRLALKGGYSFVETSEQRIHRWDATLQLQWHR